MKIEERLKDIKKEIPIVPTSAKDKLMSEIKSSPKIKKGFFKTNFIEFMPSIIMSLFIIVLIIAGVIKNNDYDSPNNELDDVIEYYSLETTSYSHLLYRITVKKKHYNLSNDITLEIEFGHKYKSDVVEFPLFENLLISIDSNDFIVSNNNIIIENFNDESYYAIDPITNSFKFNQKIIINLTPKTNLTNKSSYIKLLFKNYSKDNEVIEEEDKLVYESQIVIDYEISSSGIDFIEGAN